MLGQRCARRPLMPRTIGRWHFPFSLGFVGLQVFQLQFELLDLMVELLRPTAELQAPQFRDPQFQIFDLGCTRIQLRLQPTICSSRASSNAFRASKPLGSSAAVSMG